MSFVTSSLIGTGNAVVYQLVDTVSQYSDSAKPLTSFITNGEIIMISVGVISLGAAYYAYKKGYDVVAAFGIELGPLLIVSGVLDMLKRRVSGLSQISRVRRAPPVPMSQMPAGSRLPFTPQN